MTELLTNTLSRRAIMRGVGVGAVALTLSACASLPGLSMTDAVRRLLLLSSENAFARLTAPDGYWDQQVDRLGLANLIGAHGDVVSRILTSTLFKDRLDDAFAAIAVAGSERAAPIVADAVRTIGFANAVELVRGGPQAATTALRGELGDRLIEQMVPELGEAIRIASDPLVAEVVNAATGTDVSGIAQGLAGNIDNAIWNEIGIEEAAIRANPRSTNDPLLIGVFGAGPVL